MAAAEFQAAANHYLDAAQQEYLPAVAGELEWGGIEAISPDGAIQQVSWRVGFGAPAVTRASRNTEHKLFTPSYKERRRQEKLDALLRDVASGQSLQTAAGDLGVRV